MKNILSKSLIAVIIIVGGFAIFNFGFQYGYNQIPEAPSNLPPDADITILWDVWDKIETKYADSVDYQKMIYGAAKGLVASLGDPYSVFMEPEDSEKFMEELRGLGVRNVSVTAIAPTGSIALIAEVNSSIEPFYSLAYQRFVTEGESNQAKKKFTMTNRILGSKLAERDKSKAEIDTINEYILEHKSVQGCALVPMDLQKVFKTAHDLTPEAHINIQPACSI